MKKLMFIMMAAAAISLVSCKKENANNVDKSDTVTWGGVTYKTVKLKDGRTWMAEPLRYVPKGKTASENPNDGSGFWYPYSSDGTNCTPLKDKASIKALGYLYDYETAFGAKISEDNFKSFEGKQGICPDGWHIPTRAELIALCGSSVKGADDAAAIKDEKAAYYDKDYNGAKIAYLNADNFNWSFSGTVSKNSKLKKGSYQKVITSKTNCSVDDFLGKNALTYLMGSTGDSVVKYAIGDVNYKFFGLMSTFTLAKYPEGRLSVAFANYKGGFSVRCVKNLK